MSEHRSRRFLMEARGVALRSRRVRLWALLVLLIVLALGVQAVVPEWRLLPDFGSSLGAATILGLFLAAHFCEYIDSTLGMGYGTTLTPVLLLAGFAPLQIVPAVLFSEFVTGLAAGLLHHRDGNIDLLRDRKAQGTMVLLSVLSAFGAVAAVTLAIRIPKFWLTAIIATIILSVGVLILATIHRQLAYRRGHIIALGAVAAFNKGLSGGGYGPLVTGGQVVSGVSPKQAVAITSLAEALTCLVGLAAYVWMRGSPDWSLAVPLTVGALLSVPMATLTVQRLPEAFMRGSVGVVTCFLGLLTFVKLLS
ncbi:MAG: sulfite exporter TauE/SafE family protein [Phycisphaerae bacterium]